MYGPSKNQDHPRVRKSDPRIMSCPELRYWLQTLKNEYGWHTLCLARTVGLYDGATLNGKIRQTSGFTPKEQSRVSIRIQRILSGELVQVQSGKGGHVRYDAALADVPKPIAQPGRMVYDFKSRRLRWMIPRMGPPPALPGWNRGIKNREEPFDGSPP
jgi:hypothetical protein